MVIVHSLPREDPTISLYNLEKTGKNIFKNTNYYCKYIEIVLQLGGFMDIVWMYFLKEDLNGYMIGIN